MRIFSVLAAAALCAALLVGCAGAAQELCPTQPPTAGGVAATLPPAPVPPGTACPEPTACPTPAATPTCLPQPTAAPTAQPGGNGYYTVAGLYVVLDATISFDSGSAGSSLKNAGAAAGLAEYAALCGGTPATLADDAQAWMDGLGQAGRATLDENWTRVSLESRAIAADPAAEQELLDDAGVTTDFSCLDLGPVPDFLDVLDSVLAPQK